MAKNQRSFLFIPSLFACFIFNGIFLVSCDKEENNQVDFRDNYAGNYICTEIYSYFNPINDSIMNWSTDTISVNKEVIVEKLADSSLNVTIGNYHFDAFYDGDKKFTCSECNGPPDYVKFMGIDSIYIFVKSGVTNKYYYYGKKIQSR